MLPTYNITLDDLAGLTKMSLVHSPAVQSAFLTFASNTKMNFSIDEEKRIVFGCALRADFPIYRVLPNGEECFVVFTREVIEELVKKFMLEQKGTLVNLEHNTDITGVYLIESLIKDTPRGISPTGFEDIADGSWFVAYKVDNEDVWQRVKNGDFTGFSVECIIGITPKEDEINDLNDLIKQLYEN